MIDRRSTAGGSVDIPGFFPQLERTYGAGAFDPQGHHLSMFTTSPMTTAFEFVDSWGQLHSDYGVDDDGAEHRHGPLDAEADEAGRGIDDKLQHKITEQMEQADRDSLHRDMIALSRGDTRRIAWMAVDRLSSQIRSGSHPGRWLSLSYRRLRCQR